MKPPPITEEQREALKQALIIHYLNSYRVGSLNTLTKAQLDEFARDYGTQTIIVDYANENLCSLPTMPKSP